MNKMFVLVVLLMLSLPFAGRAHAQEVKHAPTVEQCRADQRLWSDKLENSSSLPDYKTLMGWFHEMMECKAVDPENRRDYYMVCSEIDAAEVVRLEKFLVRHGLLDKFIEEDKAGKR